MVDILMPTTDMMDWQPSPVPKRNRRGCTRDEMFSWPLAKPADYAGVIGPQAFLQELIRACDSPPRKPPTAQFFPSSCHSMIFVYADSWGLTGAQARTLARSRGYAGSRRRGGAQGCGSWSI